MDAVEAAVSAGYLVALAAFGAALVVSVRGAAAVPAPGRLAGPLAWVASAPTAGFAAGLGLAGWGLWRLAGPT